MTTQNFIKVPHTSIGLPVSPFSTEVKPKIIRPHCSANNEILTAEIEKEN
jgi:hypothetical protein